MRNGWVRVYYNYIYIYIYKRILVISEKSGRVWVRVRAGFLVKPGLTLSFFFFFFNPYPTLLFIKLGLPGPLGSGRARLGTRKSGPNCYA